MAEETDIRLIQITLFMIFISGCWTLATIIPLPTDWPTRSAQMAAVTVADVAFLLSLLASMLSYGGMAGREPARRWSVVMFGAGTTALIASILLFSASYIVRPPYYPD